MKSNMKKPMIQRVLPNGNIVELWEYIYNWRLMLTTPVPQRILEQY